MTNGLLSSHAFRAMPYSSCWVTCAIAIGHNIVEKIMMRLDLCDKWLVFCQLTRLFRIQVGFRGKHSAMLQTWHKSLFCICTQVGTVAYTTEMLKCNMQWGRIIICVYSLQATTCGEYRIYTNTRYIWPTCCKYCIYTIITFQLRTALICQIFTTFYTLPTCVKYSVCVVTYYILTTCVTYGIYNVTWYTLNVCST